MGIATHNRSLDFTSGPLFPSFPSLSPSRESQLPYLYERLVEDYEWLTDEIMDDSSGIDHPSDSVSEESSGSEDSEDLGDRVVEAEKRNPKTTERDAAIWKIIQSGRNGPYYCELIENNGIKGNPAWVNFPGY